jgi:S-adenosylmethionine:tRNA ribosyltransferase-isomerase
MKLADFYYELPNESIARFPLSKRSASRLLCLDGTTQRIVHGQFTDITNLLEEGDLLIFNDTKVIPARLFGHRPTGGKVEVLVERILDQHRILAQVRASKSPRVGEELLFEPHTLKVLAKNNQFYELQCNTLEQTIFAVIESIGQIPLPPYLHRSPDKDDLERYQTVYAMHKGSVAAPTAGLHFDEELLQQCRAKKIAMAYLTLHIGAGTFSPVRVEKIVDHKMHAEYLEVSPELCELVNKTKSQGKRVIAVGTTTLRALETASQSGKLSAYSGDTNIFIYPGYQFQCVDALITNFHLPASTLLMLVCAFGGYETVMHAYREAVKRNYRFYSYGDAMFIRRMWY